MRVLIVLSPAKSLDEERPVTVRRSTQPRLLDHTAALAEVMATKTPDDLERLMSISPALATLNHQRFQDFELPLTKRNARPAIFAFDGDVYTGMDAPDRFGAEDHAHAQKVLRILSGLYGLLRPLDLMAPYRLEMGTRLATERGKDLYQWWGDEITDLLAADLARSPGDKVLVNLASQEYFGAVRPDRLRAPVVSPVFLDADAKGKHRVISFFAKRARGTMAGWIVRERIGKAADLRSFDETGYRFDPERSTASAPVFVRDAQG